MRLKRLLATALAALLILPAAARAADALAPLPAFPGAEGFGAATVGGRGGRVIYVTNLNDSGPGSLRAAVNAKGPRTVLFKVSGTIALEGGLNIHEPFITIAGQSAPGQGICLRNASISVQTHDVVIRYLRSRLGDEGRGQDDAMGIGHGSYNVVIDHCSATWSIDECLSLAGKVSNLSIQWCLIGESLNKSKHSKGPHGYGSLSRANGPVSWHHNLWLHNDSRNPRLGDDYGRAPYPTFDVRNNVIYDFGGTCSGLTQGKLKVNYVANYIKPGPSSKAPTPITVGKPSTLEYFIRDNVVDGDAAKTADNRRFFSTMEGVSLIEAAHSAPTVTTLPAEQAYELVLASVGASRPARDSVDARLIGEVRSRGGQLRNSQKEVGGWPELASAPAPADSDGDGIPDAWERAQGLNPSQPGDASQPSPHGYTWLELYLADLAK